LKYGSLKLVESSEPVQACNGIALPFTSLTLSLSFSVCLKSKQFFGILSITTLYISIPAWMTETSMTPIVEEVENMFKDI
jgi:hypothetical protein